MKNNDSVSKNNEVGIFRALQSRMVQLEWWVGDNDGKWDWSEIIKSPEFYKAVQNYPICHGQPLNASDEINNKMNNFFKRVI